MKTYTLHVSLPGYGRVWRKLELPAEDTLEGLHRAIQDAFGFDADHLYSFFMSGRAWDPLTEYCLPDSVEPWDFVVEDEEDEEDTADREGSDKEMEAELIEEESLPSEEMEQMARFQAALGDAPLPSSVPEMLRLIENNPALRDAIAGLVSADMNIPLASAAQLLDMVGAMTSDLSEQEMSLLFEGDETRDVRTTTLESLDLKKGQSFMYLFDYGDEWRFKVRVHAIDMNADDSVDYPRLVEKVGVAPEQYQ